MTTIRSAAPIVRRPVVVAAAKAAPVAAAQPVALPKASLAQPVAKPQVVKPEAKEWTLGRVLKTAGVGVGGFVGGNVATAVVDLFFHFGNNGGTAWPGGIYLAAAGLAAAGAIALYQRAQK